MLCVEKLGTHTKNKNNFKELCNCLTFRGSPIKVCVTTTAIRLYELSFRTVVLRIMYFKGVKTGENVILPEKLPYGIYSRSTVYHPDTVLIHMHHQNEMLIRHIKVQLINSVCTTLRNTVTPAEAAKILFHGKSFFCYRALYKLQQIWTNTECRLLDAELMLLLKLTEGLTHTWIFIR